MTDNLHDIWVYLAADPLLHLTVTLAAFQAGWWLHRRCRGSALVNPVLIAVLLVGGLLTATGTDYDTYFEGAQFVHFLLGPATVALAVPLYRQLARIRRSLLALLTSLLAGSATAVLSALLVLWLTGGESGSLIAMAPKSVTAPVAMGIAEKLGGLPSLTAVFVILTGILGAILGPLLLDLLRVRHQAARGLALGTASHGIGTARAFQDSEVAGAFSGIAMGLNALATALLLPLLWALLS